MYYVYVLKSKKTNWLYIGYTSDLKRRVEQHKKGMCRSTKRYLPVELIYYEAYKSMLDAMKRENTFKKYGKVVGLLKKRITNSLH